MRSAILSRLPLSAAAAARTPGERPRQTIRFSTDAPALPLSVAREVEATWGVSIVRVEDGITPFVFSSFASLLADARAEQVVRALSRNTNLVLAGSRVLVVGDGPIAATLARTFDRIGAHVTVAAWDPRARLRAHLVGLDTIEPNRLAERRRDFVILTGEGHLPLRAVTLGGVLADASVTGLGLLAPARTSSVRRNVRAAGSNGSLLVSVPPVLPANLAAASDVEWRVADVLVALAILLADGPRSGSIDADLARLALA